MTTTRRSPPIGPEVDLKAFSFMPLEFRRLFASDTWVLGNPEEKVAALHLWCESWHQVPAGSLPSDDRLLADLSKSGVRWKKLKVHAMRGWVLCTDDRFYHPFVVEKAIEAFAKHRKASEKGVAGALKRWNKGTGPATGELFQGHDSDIARAMQIEGKGIEEKGGGKEEPFILPPWVPRRPWDEFVRMRNRQKKPLTEYAKSRVIEELSRISGPSGQDAEAILNRSTVKGWLDVYPLKSDRGSAAGGGATTLEEANRAAAAAASRRTT